MKEKRIQIEGQDTSYLIRDDGTVWSEKRNRVLQGTVERNEYRTVYLTFNGKQYNYLVHRLVAQAFCENPNDYNVVHHIDGNKLNNCANNLEWVTRSENDLHAYRNNLRHGHVPFHKGNVYYQVWDNEIFIKQYDNRSDFYKDYPMSERTFQISVNRGWFFKNWRNKKLGKLQLIRYFK